jgi:hypothetical protein
MEDAMRQEIITNWLIDWLSWRPAAMVLCSPVGQRFSADEHWTPAAHQRALEGCERALRLVRGDYEFGSGFGGQV